VRRASAPHHWSRSAPGLAPVAGPAPAIPSATEAEAAAQLNGRGVQIIDAVASARGVLPTRPCGKTVWALLEAARAA
jgi:hypothetical protein